MNTDLAVTDIRDRLDLVNDLPDDSERPQISTGGGSRGSVVFWAVGRETSDDLDVNDLWKRCVTLTHSYAGPPDDMRAALDLIAKGSVDVAAMVTHRLPLAETAEGFRLAREGGVALKVIIDPSL